VISGTTEPFGMGPITPLVSHEVERGLERGSKQMQTTPAVRARNWYREFREIVLMCAVYNIKRAVN